MQISGMQANNYSPNKPSPKNVHFGMIMREVGHNMKTLNKHITSYGCGLTEYYDKISHDNYTLWFRDNLKKVIDDLVEFYKNTNHVNTYCYGCSSGAESSSTRMCLVAQHGEKTASKFGTIMAKDYDPYAINLAKRGNIPISSGELHYILDATNGRFNRFFYGEQVGLHGEIIDFETIPIETLCKFDHIKRFNPNHKVIGCKVKQKPEITDHIDYSVANILEDWKNIEPENSVIFARNFWPYLSLDKAYELGSNLGKHLKKDSSIVFGEFDFNPGSFNKDFKKDTVKRIMESGGFEQKENMSEYIFVKK